MKLDPTFKGQSLTPNSAKLMKKSMSVIKNGHPLLLRMGRTWETYKEPVEGWQVHFQSVMAVTDNHIDEPPWCSVTLIVWPTSLGIWRNIPNRKYSTWSFARHGHTHFPSTCHLSRALLGSGIASLLFLRVPKNSLPFPDKSHPFCFYLSAFKDTIFLVLPSALSPQEVNIFRKQTQTSPEVRTVFLEVGEYSENKTSNDVLITYPATFFPFSNFFSPWGGFKDLSTNSLILFLSLFFFLRWS